MPDAPERSPHVVATAGHVDHGKSSLIVRLTGIDPDRLEEEKRRGLTIDLGFAWCTLPSGREVGFVDVPGHERFIRNMLAGVGPVRLVLFVVAADEGWMPQSEEHLQILDVLGVEAAVVALTKIDLVDEETLAMARIDVAERVAGTALAHAPIVACSSATGEGIGDLTTALDDLVAAAPEPDRAGRTRLHVDRVFAMSGAGTVVTGTLTGGPLSVGDEIELLPAATRARVRGLQTHKRRLDRAWPVSRTAVNVVGADRTGIRRGDVLVHPGRWRPTPVFEVSLSPVRGVTHELSGRGAYKVYAGAAERDGRVRIYGGGRVSAGQAAFARIRVAEPLVLAFGDRFVLRDAGRDETVAGGVVLDTAPPRRAGRDPEARLRARQAAPADELARVVVRERGAIRRAELETIVGTTTSGRDAGVGSGDWWLATETLEGGRRAAVDAARAYQAEHPLDPGAPVTAIRDAIARGAGPSLASATEAILDALVGDGTLEREGAAIRTPDHRPALADRTEDIDRLVRAVEAGGAAPPTIGDLVSAGHARGLIDAAVRTGVVIRVGPDIVVPPGLVERALDEIRSTGTAGMTVSALRERLGTSRKYAVPLVEYLDTRGLTIRRGDVRIARGAGSRPAGS